MYGRLKTDSEIRNVADRAVNSRNSCVCPRPEGNEKIATKLATATGRPTIISGRRLPSRECRPSESEPMNGSETASMTRPSASAAPASPPDRPQTAVT